MRVQLIGLALLVALVGCSSSGDSAADDQRGWASQIRFIEPAMVGDRGYEELTGLVEDSPITASGEDAAIDRAKGRMRQRAAEIDADAVVLVGCERGTDPEDRSISSGPIIRCQGVAIRWTQP